MFVRWVVPFLIGIILFWVIGWLTGDKDYDAKDDERSEFIKQKAIVRSWVLLIMFFIINFVFDFFNLTDERLALVPFVYPELFYLLIAIISYFVYYWIYSKRMSSSEK